nr:probable isoprenylcysteine alpha-carbonyl methylesterase ICMEL2 isoform X1 [Ipomoea batatas]
MATAPRQGPASLGSFVNELKKQRDEGMDAHEPLFSRVSSLPASANNQRRRKTITKTKSAPCRPARQSSFSRDIGHAAAETYLITRLSFKLLSYLGVGYRWITRLLALGLYAMLLMPGFAQVGFYYFFSPQVRRSVVYGSQPRNRLDLYLPTNRDGSKPVVVFVTGGAWIIGYKAWGSLLGKQLAERDIIVACLDYRNFPQGTISDMVDDVSQGISFICNNIAEYGGDPDRIYLMGQSAGAHISSCALVRQAIKESKGETISWSASAIKAYFGSSGGYHLPSLVDHFNGRGLYRSIFMSIMEGEKSLKNFSPEMLVQDPSSKAALSLLPNFILFHGTDDRSIPSNASKTFADALLRVGGRAEVILYDGKTHTDLFLQDPLRGGQDDLFDYVVALIHADDKEALANDANAPPRRRLVPEILLQLARLVSPF